MKKVVWEENCAKILSENKRKLFKTKIIGIRLFTTKIVDY